MPTTAMLPLKLLWLSALDVQLMRMEMSAAPSVWVVAKSASFLHHYQTRIKNESPI
jgi:hypothetical protein